MISTRDVVIKKDSPNVFLREKHIKYLKHYADEEGPEQIMSEFLRMSGMYWCINALFLMKAIDRYSPELEPIIEFVTKCQCKNQGGFCAALKHDPHILHTLSAIQILVLVGKCTPDYIDIDKCVSYIKSLQQEDGSFFGDKWGEVDTRFSFCALASLKLLKRLDAIDVDKAIKFVEKCHNSIDGGFGSKPGSESHAAYVYCCVGSYAIADKLDKLKYKDILKDWLSERQLPSGGLNGRPEKLPDLCYSWWCLSSLSMIEGTDNINLENLCKYILACQNTENGGFGDRPGNDVDPYHTMFAVASLSLIWHAKNSNQEDLKRINPILCMPSDSLT